MKTRAIVASAAVIGGLGAISTCSYLNSTGFCYNERRYLSDGELIEKAIRYNLANPHSAPDLVAYSTFDDFLKSNPHCCVVHHEGHYTVEDGPLLYRLLGWHDTVVEIWYRRRESGPTPYYRSYVAVDACGRVVNRLGPFERGAGPGGENKGG